MLMESHSQSEVKGLCMCGMLTEAYSSRVRLDMMTCGREAAVCDITHDIKCLLTIR